MWLLLVGPAAPGTRSPRARVDPQSTGGSELNLGHIWARLKPRLSWFVQPQLSGKERSPVCLLEELITSLPQLRSRWWLGELLGAASWLVAMQSKKRLTCPCRAEFWNAAGASPTCGCFAWLLCLHFFVVHLLCFCFFFLSRSSNNACFERESSQR